VGRAGGQRAGSLSGTSGVDVGIGAADRRRRAVDFGRGMLNHSKRRHGRHGEQQLAHRHCILIEGGADVAGNVTNTSTGVLTTNGTSSQSQTGISSHPSRYHTSGTTRLRLSDQVRSRTLPQKSEYCSE
jgi:hypothetical protein